MFRKSKLHLSLQIRWKCRIRWKVGKHFQTRSWLVFIRFPLFSFRYSYCFVFYRINVGSSLMNPRFVRSRRFVGRSRNTLEQEADSCRFIFRDSSYFTLYFRNVSIGCWKSQNDERKQAVSWIIKMYEKFTLYSKHLTLVNSFPKVRETTRWNEVSSFRIVISSKWADNVFEKWWLVRENHLASEPSNGKQSTDRKPSHLAWKSF